MPFGHGNREQVTLSSEVWRELNEYPGYAVSDHGRVMNTHTDMVKRPSRNQQGIVMVNLSINRVQQVRSVALLVISAFASDERPSDYFDTPIHRNGERTDCAIWNLLWRPRWFARKYHQQFHPAERSQGLTFREPIMDEDTEIVYPTSWTAATTHGLLDKDIFLSTVNRTIVFPTNQRFRTLRDE